MGVRQRARRLTNPVTGMAYDCLTTAFLIVCLLVTGAEGQGSCTAHNCTAGEFFDSGVCLSCRTGYICPGGSNAPEPCPVGTFNSLTRQSNSSSCQPCHPGTYTYLHGRVSCDACPSGFKCPHHGTSEPVACLEGQYAVNETSAISGPTDCQECPKGSRCPVQWTLPIPCENGYYANKTGSLNCSLCPAGYFCSDPAFSPQPCSAGFYSGPGQTNCTICPAGRRCPVTATTQPIECQPGRYSYLGSIECADCPTGYHCPTAYQDPIQCSLGQYTNVTGQKTCSDCEAGHNCLRRNKSLPCPRGTHSLFGQASCTPCSSGFFSREGSISCLPCPVGHECYDPSQEPGKCSEGYFATGAANNCTICQPGSLSDPQRGLCISCPAGQTCVDPRLGHGIDCPLGTWILEGINLECRNCSPGYFCPDPKTPPEECKLGSYSGFGAVSCSACPAGAECLSVDLHPQSCDPGYYSLEGDYVCHKCQAGTACPLTTQHPIDCLAGSYSPEGVTRCTSCPPGSECPNPALPPTLCSSGQYSLANYTECVDCPAGSSCNSTGSSPTPCSPGYYSTGLALLCLECPAGSKCPTTANTPIPCTPGEYSSAGSVSCTTCPQGFACPNISDPTTVHECQPGSYSVGGKQHCTLCSVGKFCTNTKSGEELPCPPGTYSDIRGRSYCDLCEAGYECPNHDGTGKAECSRGFYSTGGAIQCTICPAGSKCPFTDQAVVIQCPPGSFSAKASTKCSECRAGYECSTSSGEEVRCGSGYYSLGNQSHCVGCPAGHACPDTDAKPVPCDPGWFSLGLTMECEECDRGHYCPHSNEGGQSCPVGTYSDQTGATVCKVCPAGHQCSDSTSAVICPAGTYSFNGSTTCLPCDAGYVCTEGSTSPSPSTGECPAGGWCDGNQFHPCESGKYNNVSMPNETIGQQRKGPEVCLDCLEGYYCIGPGAINPFDYPCPAGHYCPVGTKFPTQFPCPDGTYNTNTTQMSLESGCLPNQCPEGFYCPQGTVEPIICPQGYYCPLGTGNGFQHACPLGTYGVFMYYENDTEPHGLSSVEDCRVCLPGFYCPDGSGENPATAPVPCPPGTYNPFNGTGHPFNCLTCTPGFACPQANQTTVTVPCDEGHYCPNGTISSSQYPCPPGTFTGSRSLTSPEECTICPPGKSCGWATGLSVNIWLDCNPGHYCPLGTPSPDKFPCPPGTYTPKSNLTAPEECSVCPETKYCTGGKSQPDALCLPGYYCPEGTRLVHEFPCPATTYNPHFGKSQKSACLNCTRGHFCEEATVRPIDCPSGTYMPFGVGDDNETVGTPAENQSSCLPCLAGHFCLNGTVNPRECGVGRYSAVGQSACIECPSGHFCDSTTTTDNNLQTTKLCLPGKYCPVGLTNVNNALPCSKGYYCPEGTAYELPCPVGTFNPSPGASSLDDCLPCTAGFYCLENSTEVSGFCDPGFYCPVNITNGQSPKLIGSYGPQQVPCPQGTYQSNYSSAVEGDCVACPAGSYCPVGSAEPLDCPRGYYCGTAVGEPEACPIGTFGNRTGLMWVEDCTNCTKGRFCDAPGLPGPRGPCDPGYLCYGGAYTSTPTDGVTGEICPRGGYCPLGSFQSKPCPPGTFNNNSESVNFFDCFECTPGFYCSDARGPEPTGPCDPGFYCTGGAQTARQHVAEPGFFAPSGSANQVSCPLGTYNPFWNASKCLACALGHYCPNVSMTEPLKCPVGHYCPEGTEEPQRCPPGTYSSVLLLASADNCTKCPAGKFCQSGGLAAPEGDCHGGHICRGGSITATPVVTPDTPQELHINDICSPGFYCPNGTSFEVPCPPGTYSEGHALYNKTQCKPCSPGFYCPKSNMSIEADLPECDAGFFCTLGSSVGRPVDDGTGDICSPGHYCPAGSPVEFTCSPGLYANDSGLAECLICPEGFYCIADFIDPQPCPIGYFCGVQTGADYQPCPSGTYGANEGLVRQTDCTVCPGGMYCELPAQSNATGECDPGFWCREGAQSARPSDHIEGYYGVCPTGYYCSQGSVAPEPCHPGFYQPSLQKTNVSNCIPCDSGKYCAEGNQAEPTGNCSAGWYCTEGSHEPQPGNTVFSGSGDIDENTTVIVEHGGRCPPGFYCPEGSSLPLQCLPGTYSNRSGNEECGECPGGYYCSGQTVNPFDHPCPSGFYCLSGTKTSTQYPCPVGKFNSLTARSSIADCVACTPGFYCETKGLSYPTSECPGGVYCPSGQSSSTGKICRAGKYCPPRSSVERPCIAGQFCSGLGNSAPSGNCSAGYYCVEGSKSSQPSTGNCPEGSYCPEGSASPTPCPPGTFTNETLNQNESDCKACLPGFYCSGYGNTAVDGPCVEGYYCPPGQTQAAPSQFVCPVGHFCLQQSLEPVRCSPGYYQNETGQSSCKRCLSGYYCDNSLEPIEFYGEFLCPPGYYCEEGTEFATQYPCPAGTFSNKTGLSNILQCADCSGGYYCGQSGLDSPEGKCSAGFYCPSRQKVVAPPANPCSPGKYCPEASPAEIPCPLGTYNPGYQLRAEYECIDCPPGKYCAYSGLSNFTGPCAEGYYCKNGSQAFHAEWLLCPSGSYCPLGSPDPIPCPNGTFSNTSGLKSESDCTPCLAGLFCIGTGLTEPSGNCMAGYYCPVRTNVSQPIENPCPPGHFCPPGTPEPIPCRHGEYQPNSRQPSCIPCPAGFYCTNAVSRPFECPSGYYCPEGTGSEYLPCLRGTFNNETGGSNITACKPCLGGHYCDEEALSAPSGKCSPGYFCRYGSDRSQPAVSDELSLGYMGNETCVLIDGYPFGDSGVCPVGHYCPVGTAEPIPCPAGNYSGLEGNSICDPCPAGYYCTEGSSGYDDKPCPAGYYCPFGTEYDKQYPCPHGFFNDQLYGQSLLNCKPCTGGHFCASEGLSNTSGLCDGGHYCQNSATISNPRNLEVEGGERCVSGTYCPSGSAAPTHCDPGYYCLTDGLSAPTNHCQAGFYCTLSSASPNPTDNVTGNICPKGQYCPKGSSRPSPCPLGTFYNVSGNTQEEDCVSCLPGQFCNQPGLSLPTGYCDEGFYCPQGSTNAHNVSCPQGYFCDVGSSFPILCPSGAYQDLLEQSLCKACPEGYYCDSTILGSGEGIVPYEPPQPCPLGHYCPNGTKFDTEYPCPHGTFGNETKRYDVSHCQQCLPGQHCDGIGLIEPVGFCEPGYFCKFGAKSSTPRQGENADICPTGHYCLQGTVEPDKCPQGTFNPSQGLTLKIQCLNCTGGHFCGVHGSSNVTGDCEAGYYCDSGATHSQWKDCPAGFFCPSGSGAPIACPVGTFSPDENQKEESDCRPCIPGFYCNSEGQSNVTGLCGSGFYCPSKSISRKPAGRECSVGMHCPEGSEVEQPCPAGMFTNRSQQHECEVCPRGYYCLPVQPHNASNAYQLCPRGYYCEEGTGLDWRPCPAGTYSDIFGLSTESECMDCDGGKACEHVGLTSPTSNCSAGYYCISGIDRPNPTPSSEYENSTDICSRLESYRGIGGECPLGHYCPVGSVYPLSCPAGTYNSLIRQAVCSQCPEGYYCPENSTDYNDKPCPVGHYCLKSTEYSTQYPCPKGTFNPSVGQANDSGCVACSPGKFCSQEGLREPSGNCSGGWYCESGATAPNTTTSGGRCPAGYYCPEGSGAPIPCPGGQYCQFPGFDAPTGHCSAGYVCHGKAMFATPVGGVTGEPCPAGFYCPNGSAHAIPCPPGTYSSGLYNQELNDCNLCDPGKYCGSYNLTIPTGNCSAGYFCPDGSDTNSPLEHICPVGHFCISGSRQPQRCPSGFYQDEVNKDACKVCPLGFFCDNQITAVSLNSSVCPPGYYCPLGTKNFLDNPCPPGTYGNASGLYTVEQCTSCDAGYLCPEEGLTYPTQLCTIGYFCRQKANSSSPRQGDDANVCPKGRYCPEGSDEPRLCPIGTFSSVTGLGDASECTPCTAGSHCTEPGQSSVSGQCKAGYYCPTGSSNMTSIICPAGYFCTGGLAKPIPCPRGTYNPIEGITSVGSCTQCKAGMYCNSNNLTAPTGACSPGYYCPAGQKSPPKKNDGAFGGSIEPLMPIDYAIGVGTFRPNNAIVMMEDAVELMTRMMAERGIVHTTSECTLRAFTCRDVDPMAATPAEIERLRTIQIGHRVDGIVGGLAVEEDEPGEEGAETPR